MRAMWCVVAVALCNVPCASSACAQPILDRVERFFREQVGVGQDSAPPPAATATERAYLGLTADDRQDLGRGVRIVSVNPGGPAADSGLLAGDLITQLDARPIRVMADMASVLETKRPGDRLAVSVDRAGARRSFEITLGQRSTSQVPATPSAELPIAELPAPAGAALELPPPPRPRLGVRTLPLTEQIRQENNLPSATGATVVHVEPGSAADRAGIPLGAVITAVDGQPIDNPHALATAIGRAGDRAEVTFLDRGLRMQKEVVLVAAGEPPLELRARPIEAPPRPSVDAASAELPAPDAAAPALPAGAPVLAPANTPEISDAASDRVQQLEERIRQLEARLEKLEAAAAGDNP